jgi:hypothetical protein
LIGLGRAVFTSIRTIDAPALGDTPLFRRREGRTKAGQSPGSKEWSGKAGAARGDAPTDNRAHPNDSTDTGLAIGGLLMNAQIERRNSSGPDLRGDWGVETEAGALRAATG